MPGLLRPLTVFAVACLAWSVLPVATASAADQVYDLSSRGRSAGPGPTPHLRVVCYDVNRRKIPCAYSANVAAQIAHYPCAGCAPVALWPSRYSGYGGWWW